MLIDIVFPETINPGINCNNLVRAKEWGQARGGGGSGLGVREQLFKAVEKNILAFLKTEREENPVCYLFCCISYTAILSSVSLLGQFSAGSASSLIDLIS